MSNPVRQLKYTLYWIVAVLIALAVWRMGYKIFVLDYSLDARATESVWQIQAEVSFEAEGGPVRVSLQVPATSTPGFRTFGERIVAPGYGVSTERVDGVRRVIFSKREATGRQKLYYTVSAFDTRGARVRVEGPPPEPRQVPALGEPQRSAAEEVLRHARERSADGITLAARLIEQLNAPTPSHDVEALLENPNDHAAVARLLIQLLAREKVQARRAMGVFLASGKRRADLAPLVEVYDQGAWVLMDPQTGRRGLPSDCVLWQALGRSLIEVEGGKDSAIALSVVDDRRPSAALYEARAESIGSQMINLSVYGLPIEEQNVFKKLLLVPLGVLVVVLMRNLVGIKTSGTFMPILIAMAFFETRVLPGLAIFIVIITAGLVIRGALTKLNLLLVPRVAAVVIVVVLLMLLISILSYKLGLEQGLTVTFFPMIIIAWTIERLSIAWEEEGAGEALMQTGGSLLVAVLAYLAMDNAFSKHLVFNFPEVNLIFLAAVLLIGTYTGYRLSELRRFEPLVEGES